MPPTHTEAAPTPATSAVEHSPDAADTPTKKVRKAKSKSSASGEPRKQPSAQGFAVAGRGAVLLYSCVLLCSLPKLGR